MTLERKEYQETKTMRTVSPVRNSRQNLMQFDSNLDYLLEDLQSSVSRPGSSLENNTNSSRDTSHSIKTQASGGARSNSLSRITNVKSSNPVTEYSSDDIYNYSSPNGRKKVTGYLKEKYMYKSSSSDVLPEKTRMQNSINQLDSLLDDLQQVKKSSYSEKEFYKNIGLDPTLQTTSSQKTVNKELEYGDSPRHNFRNNNVDRLDGEGFSKRELQYSSEGTYGDLRPIRSSSPSPSSRTSTLSKQTRVTNIHEYPMELVESVAPDLDPEVLAHLDPNLRPPGNTKVTTTIKTYTYEIPGSGDYPTNLSTSTAVDNNKFVYSPNQTITTPSKSFIYNKVENRENTLSRQEPGWNSSLSKSYKETILDNVKTNYTSPPYQKPAPPGSEIIKETITTRNYQPGYNPEQNLPNQQTYVYNENTTIKNINQNDYPQPPPPRHETTIFKESHNTTINKNESPYSERGYPIYNPPDNQRTTYIIKETQNTTNKVNGSPYHNGYPGNEPGKTTIYKHETHSTSNLYGPGGMKQPKDDVESFDPNYRPFGKKPNEPVNIHYSYKSTNTSQNTYKGGYPPSDETQTLLPVKFPIEDGSEGPRSPPKRLDDLMATIGNEPPNSSLNAGYNAHEQEIAHQKKIETLKLQSAEVDDNQKKEIISRTKNVSGPPVYYPPGHEMFAKKEEAEGAWRAQGGYAKASGKYEYEAESKSKSKSSSGATVVPVCLPLCCGLPCAIL